LALPILFFVSGALGLVYEVLWMRQLTVLFGATTLATTATLSAFFLGLAGGSAALGARARTWRRPLLAFGVLEIGVALGAGLVPEVLSLYGDLYPSLARALSSHPGLFTLVKLLLAMIALGLPTFCMGGTLPALAETVALRRVGPRVSVGGLYAANLAGATLGALAVPFLLLPRLGAEASVRCAMAGSVLVGVAACVLGAGAARDAVGAPRSQASTTAATAPRGVMLLGALSGVFTLALQTLWTRMFSLVHENSIYSFSVVVVLFLVGLSAGAVGARVAIHRSQAPTLLLARSWAAAGLLILASPRVFERLTDGLAFLPSADWLSSLGRLLWVGIPTLLPATIAMGMVLPLLIEHIGAESRSLGRLLAMNTMGAILGPLLATFALGPMLGLWKSLVLIGVSIVACGMATALAPRERWAWGGLLVAALAGLRPFALPAARVGPGERLVSVREGSHGTTAVIEDDRDRWITVNNSYVLGGRAAAEDERWQGHLPLLLHPSPRRVAFLGLGTGITAGAALLHPVERVLALELVPEVVAAAGEDFKEMNGGLARDRRVTLVTDDARNYLAASPAPFDVIVGDLLVPWRPGEAALYTQEHFETVRRALAPDGLCCQWVPLYQLSAEQLAILLRTFAAVFPDTTLWRGHFLPDEPALAMVGHLSGRPLDVAGIDRRTAALGASLRGAESDNPFLQAPAGLWLFAVGPLRNDARWLGADDGRRNRDGNPWVELLSPRRRGGLGGAPLEALLEAAAAEPLEGTPLAALDAAHRGFMRTGAALGRASLARTEEGEQAVLALLRTLPADLQRALEVSP
jgi:spermidine synthase